MSLRKKLLFSTIVFVTTFLFAEAVLWTAGVETVVEKEDPFRGFSGLVSVYERQGDEYRTRAAKGYVTFNPQRFLVDKPSNGLRVFAVGGSSAFGFPWGARESFVGWLGEILAEAHPERHVEAINAAGVSYASHRLRLVTEELARYEPDVLIVYSGHNEFVEPSFFEALQQRSPQRNRVEYAVSHSRIYSAMRAALEAAPAPPTDGDQSFDTFVRRETAVYDGEQKQAIVAAFTENLREIVRLGRAGGARVVLATVPANLRGWAPAASLTGSRPGSDRLLQWNRERIAGEQALELQRPEVALDHLRRASELEPGHAATHYLLARAAEAAGDWEQAAKAYREACDLDASPVRRVSAINEAIRRVASEEGALLVDVERVFEARSEHRIVGFNLIEDYVHPNLEGHRLIAREIWEATERSGWYGPDVSSSELFDAVALRRQETAEPHDAAWLFNQGVVLRHQGHTSRALEKFEQALELSPGYQGALINLGQLWMKLGNAERAAVYTEALLRVDPESTPGQILNGRILLARGQPAEAARSLQQALAASPTSADARYNLGLALRMVGRLDEAEAALRHVLELQPDHATARLNLGLVRGAQGRTKQGLIHVRRAIELAPGLADAHVGLGGLLQAQRRFDEAIAAYRVALENDPDHLVAHNNLGVALHGTGRIDEAIEHFQAGLRLDPGNSALHNNVGSLLRRRGRADEAVAHYRKAIEIEPEYAQAHYNLALVLEQQGQAEQARPHRKEAARLDPSLAR